MVLNKRGTVKVVFLVLTAVTAWFVVNSVLCKNDLRARKAPEEKIAFQETINNKAPDNSNSNFNTTFAPNKYVYSISGKEFDFDTATFNTAQTILKTQTFKKAPIRMDKKATLPRVIPVTAASSNHYQELRKDMMSVLKFSRSAKLVFYDLGLEKEQIEELRRMAFVDYRQFHFTNYPPHVADLLNYAWKVLIIQETLVEFEAIMWMDSSIYLDGTISTATEQMLRENSGFLFPVIHGRNMIISATHPNMLEYIPSVRASALRNNVMQQATGMIVINTLKVQRDVMKWAVLCVLCKNCIAPSGSSRLCRPELLGKDHYIGCHRYDQALFNLLVSNAYNFQLDKYVFIGNQFLESKI